MFSLDSKYFGGKNVFDNFFGLLDQDLNEKKKNLHYKTLFDVCPIPDINNVSKQEKKGGVIFEEVSVDQEKREKIDQEKKKKSNMSEKEKYMDEFFGFGEFDEEFFNFFTEKNEKKDKNQKDDDDDNYDYNSDEWKQITPL